MVIIGSLNIFFQMMVFYNSRSETYGKVLPLYYKSLVCWVIVEIILAYPWALMKGIALSHTGFVVFLGTLNWV